MKRKFLTLLTILGCGIACSYTSYSKTAFNIYNQKENAGLKYAASEVVDDGTAIGADIFKFTVDSYTSTPTTNTIRFTIERANSSFKDNYTLGVYETVDLPAYIKCDLVANETYAKENGTKQDYRETVRFDVDRGGNGGDFTAISSFYGLYTATLYCTIELNYGLEIDFDSLVLCNVFHADIVEDEIDGHRTFVPDLEEKYNIPYIDNKGATKLPALSKLEDSIKFNDSKYLGMSKNLDTYSIRAQIVSDGVEFYKAKKGRYYNEFEDKIVPVAKNEGDIYIRSRFSWNANSIYEITTKDAEGKLYTHKIPTIGQYVKLNTTGTTDINIFVDEEYIHGELVDFKIMNFSYTMGLYTDKENRAKTGVDYSEYFGSMVFRTKDVVDYEGNTVFKKVDTTEFTDILSVLLIVFLITSGVFIGLDVALYFFLKNKNKDDEFKKMVTSTYVMNSIHGYIFVASFVMEIMFIIFRCGIYNNSVIVANNLDPWIICLGIIAVIWFGFWVKYAITQIKNMIEKNRVEKLKLNVINVDDGTK